MVVADVQTEDDIPFFDIIENVNRGLKNFAAKRRIPIHDRLIELGFMDYVQRARKRGGDLFPDLRPKTHVKGGQTSFGDRLDHVSRRGLDIALKGNPRRLVFHSMRHHAIHQFSLDGSLPEKVRYDLVGHEARWS